MSLDIELFDKYCTHCKRGDSVFSINITHNLGPMADRAGLYSVMWRPSENGFTKAYEVIDYLLNGLYSLEKEPEIYKRMNPENGWGSYEYLVFAVREYIAACKEYPNAMIKVSR